MVFSAIQAYLDPANWQQHPPVNNYQTGTASNDSQLVPQPPPPPPPYGGSGSIRPGSMTDRARLANVPMPESAAKCPRCDSTNTKFCYFNNYSLSQPRHFCKTCRRYWTRGGALRNVPVGGGLRRNRRTKSTNTNNSSSHKSQDSNNNSNGNTDTVMTVGSTLTSSGPIFSHENILSQQMLHPMRFMTPPNANQFNELININHNNNLGGFSNYYGGISGQESVLAGLEQWRTQRQQPELALLGGNNNNTDYHFSGFNQFENGIELSGMNTRPKIPIPISQSSIPARLALVKGDAEYSYKWDGAGSSASSWTDFSNFSSSSAGNQI